MRLAATTYSAFRGYAWSSVPEGFTTERLMTFCRVISEMRGDFPDPLAVEVGLVSDGDWVAAFTLQNVERWDAQGRASDYFAFAFIPGESTRDIDFVALVNNDFFWTPSRTPPSVLDYGGPASEPCPEQVKDGLKKARGVELANPHAVCDLLAAWRGRPLTCRLCEGNVFEITRHSDFGSKERTL